MPLICRSQQTLLLSRSPKVQQWLLQNHAKTTVLKKHQIDAHLLPIIVEDSRCRSVTCKVLKINNNNLMVVLHQGLDCNNSCGVVVASEILDTCKEEKKESHSLVHLSCKTRQLHFQLYLAKANHVATSITFRVSKMR